MIILMLRMIRMIILRGQDDGSWFMAHGSEGSWLKADGSWPRGAGPALGPGGAPGPAGSGPGAPRAPGPGRPPLAMSHELSS